MGQTLGRGERLHKRDFTHAKWTRSCRSTHFLLFKSKNVQPTRRFGVVVSRKVARGAVERNRIKRLVREFSRLNKQLFDEYYSYSVRLTRMPPVLRYDGVSRELRALVTGDS